MQRMVEMTATTMTAVVGAEAAGSKSGLLTLPPRLPLPHQLPLSTLCMWLLPMHCQW